MLKYKFDLDAKKLPISHPTEKAIEAMINEQLLLIKNKINEAVRESQNVIVIPLPYTIHIPSLSLKKAQVQVYYGITKTLKTFNYEIVLDINVEKEKTNLIIKWISPLGDDNESDKLRFLKSISKGNLDGKKQEKERKRIDYQADNIIERHYMQMKKEPRDESFVNYAIDLSDEEL